MTSDDEGSKRPRGRLERQAQRNRERIKGRPGDERRLFEHDAYGDRLGGSIQGNRPRQIPIPHARETPEQEQQEAIKAQQVEAIQQQIIAIDIQLKEAIVAKVQAEAQKLAMPQETGGDEQQYAMVKLQAMEQELRSLQQMEKLQQQIRALKLQLADKSGELQLASRKLDIEEQKVHVDARTKAEQLVLGNIAANRPVPAAKQGRTA